MSGRIVNLQPANGWSAVYLRGGNSDSRRRARFDRVPVAVWALVEHDDGHQGIVGMEAGADVELMRLDVPPASSFSHYWLEGSTVCACAAPEADDTGLWCSECASSIRPAT
jgi:hypothetical protein